ncbi:ABC transporter ATP-binding protein [Mycoplasmatota bacterium]|nr:ABC transporter ATP-binding protein [Mycoplasmatota bacterium]
MMEYKDSKVERSMSDITIIKRLVKYAKPYKVSFIITFALMIFAVGIQLLQPYIFGEVFGVFEKPTFEMKTLFMYLGLYFSITAVASITSYFQQIILQKTGQNIVYDIRKEIFTHMEYQSIKYLNNQPTGVLVSRITNDTNTVSEMYTSVLVNMSRDLLTVIGIIAAMLYLNLKLASLVIIVIPILLVSSYLFRRVSRSIYRKVRKNVAIVNAFLSEHLSGMKIVQIFNQEAEKFDEFLKVNKKLRRSHLQQILAFAFYRPTIYLLHITSISIVILFGGYQVIDGLMTIALVITFKTYVDNLFQPIQMLAEQFNILQSALASSERIFGILDDNQSISEEPDALDLDSIKGEIEFKNVWFKYIEDEWILKDVSFKINPKESFAFVGATGAGKTTILKLITRDWDIQRGQILIDGIDIKKIRLHSLRKYIGVMLQDVFMFSGTIKSNITLKDDTISNEELVEAATYVNANQFIEKLPMKYNEEVTERGLNFSQGQRQLLSFARTLLHKPSVMILDEATANIDTETEQLIQDSLSKMMSIGTMLIVAHRLSTIQYVDKIVVLHKGEIVEIGSHQELLKNKGMYYSLYQIQYKERPV